MQAVRTPGLCDRFFNDDTLGAQRGEFEIITEPNGQRRFWFVCPGPCRSIAALALRPVVEGSGASWAFDGNEDAPTLSPSIHHVGCWHGWLNCGQYKEV